MTKTFTHDDVIMYIYDELSSAKRKEIEQAILCDSNLEDLYKELITMKKELDMSMKAPSDNVTEGIVNYSKSLNLCSNN